jgi:hypothetical protein
MSGRVCPEMRQTLTPADRDPQLLMQLAGKGLLRGLPKLDLTPRKLPQTAARLSERAARDQHAARGVLDNGYDNTFRCDRSH